MKKIINSIWLLYYEGFKTMTVGKKLWLIILLKLGIMFLILKPIFFSNYLKSNFSSDQEKSEHIINELTK